MTTYPTADPDADDPVALSAGKWPAPRAPGPRVAPKAEPAARAEAETRWHKEDKVRQRKADAVAKKKADLIDLRHAASHHPCYRVFETRPVVTVATYDGTSRTRCQLTRPVVGLAQPNRWRVWQRSSAALTGDAPEISASVTRTSHRARPATSRPQLSPNRSALAWAASRP